MSETGAALYFCGQRLMSSEGPAVDDAGACAFGQVGFGRYGVGGWLMATGATQSTSIDVSHVRVLQVGTEFHAYLAQQQGFAVGPAAWIAGTYGYSTDGVPLIRRSPATYGAGARFGGHGVWGIFGFGGSERVGPQAITANVHIPWGDRAALGGVLEQSMATGTWAVDLRACLGWGGR